MPYGTQNPLVGSNVNPALFIQDYSQYQRADAARISQVAGLFDAMSNAATAFADIKKQQSDQKAALKASAAEIDAAATLFPEMKGTLEGFKAQITNEELPISERAAIASRISGVINMGVDQMRNQQDFGLRQQQANLQAQESGMRQLALGQELQAAESKNAAIEANVPLLMEMLQKQNEQTKAISPETMSKISGMTDKRAQADAITSAIKLTAPEGTEYSDVKDFKIGDQIVQGRMNFRTGEIQPATIATVEAPKITTFGFQADPYKDSNSLAGIGAFVPKSEQDKIKAGQDSVYKMRDNDFAVSPDMEQVLRSNGIKPMDSVNIVLSNGEKVQGRWMDRTAQDADIKAGKIKGVTQPLRGRIDLYTPGGVNPNDGVSVAGIVKSDGTPIPLAKNVTREAISSATSGQVSPELQYRMQQDAKAESRTMVEDSQKAATDLANSQEMLNTLEKLEKSPGFNGLFGTIGTTWIAGSAASDAKVLFEQLQAKGFLESVKSMKGMGALSDAEGAKLDKAYLGLSTSMSETAAKERIQELKATIKSGIDRIKSGKLLQTQGQTQSDPFQSATQRLLSLPKQ